MNPGTTELLCRPGMDRMFDALRKRHRRLLLLQLRHGRIASEADVMTRDGDAEEVELELRHTHLPKLEEAGHIEWDRDTGAITKGSRFDEIEPLLDLIETHADELPPDWP